jgi:RNA polymerase sigma-70 factor (ECF subfamily)
MDNAGPSSSPPSGQPELGPAAAERDVVARAASGDTAAFERLYRTHVGRVHALAVRMLSVEEAGEATQDVFVRAWQRLASFRGEAAFGTWLHRVAINVILTRRAAHGTRRDRFVDDDELLDRLPAKAGRADVGMDLGSAIATLPGGAKQVFVLHDIEGYRHEEIAERLGVTTGTTKAQLHRARMLLRRRLSA